MRSTVHTDKFVKSLGASKLYANAAHAKSDLSPLPIRYLTLDSSCSCNHNDVFAPQNLSSIPSATKEILHYVMIMEVALAPQAKYLGSSKTWYLCPLTPSPLNICGKRIPSATWSSLILAFRTSSASASFSPIKNFPI